MRLEKLLVAAVAAAVGVAFADSSIVVLALPELYVDLQTSVVGISWVITAYNLVVFVASALLLALIRRLRPERLVLSGLVLFLAASVACGVAGDLTTLVAARAAQGLGGALLLAGSLPLLAALTGSGSRAVAVWALAGTLGAAFGPAAGGVLTELFEWRSIFFAQAPIAALAILAGMRRPPHAPPPQEPRARDRRLVRANAALVFVFAALVGALFLAVLLIVTVWELGPLKGAGVVSALPAAAIAIRPLASALPGRLDVVGGSALLASGLAGLALLPADSVAYAVPALGLCGAGLGLVLPPLTRQSVSETVGLAWSGTLSVATRHAGLVLALVLIAPLLAYELDRGGDRATIAATDVIIEARLPLTSKVPISLDLRDAFEQAADGEIPDLERVFEENGAADDDAVATTRDDLVGSIRSALTRSFRSAFGMSALFALLAIAPAAISRRRVS
jgi:MFS family permease